MNLMKILAVTIAIALIAVSPSHAQNSDKIVSEFEDSTVSRLLRDVGADFSVEAGIEGQKIYRARAPDGMVFSLAPRACSSQDGCVGLLLIAVFTRSDRRSIVELDDVLNRYNDLNPNGKVYRMKDGTVVLQGYINAVHGISHANAQAQLLVFGQEVAKVREALRAFSMNQ